MDIAPITQANATPASRTTESLTKSFKLAEAMIARDYLVNVSAKDIRPFQVPGSFKWNTIRLFRIDQVVLNPEENTQDKLMTVFSALQSAVTNGSVFLAIRGEKEGQVEYCFGVATEAAGNTGAAAKVFEANFKGNFTGSNLIELNQDDTQAWFEPLQDKNKAIACLTVLPAPRSEDKDASVQGMEKLADALAGHDYTAIILATSTSRETILARKRGLERLSSALSPYAKVSLAFGENESEAISEAIADSTSTSISEGISHTLSTSTSTSAGTSTGTSSSNSINGFGDTFTTGRNEGQSWNKTDGATVARGTSHNETQQTGKTTTDSTTRTLGSSLTRTIEAHNKTVAKLLETLDNSLKRIEQAEAFGLWETACYFIANDVQTAILSANSYKALVTGDVTGHEKSHLNIWSPVSDPTRTMQALSYLAHARHPLIRAFSDSKDFTPPACLVSGRELPILLGLPLKNIPGVVVNTMAGFGRNVFVKDTVHAVRRVQIGLGNIFHMGNEENTRVDLDLDSLTAHCFISGTTGSGKSTTTYTLINRLMEQHIPFLVIEPAKGEYKDEFATVAGINIYTTSPRTMKMLRINPFEFRHSDIHVLEHMDRLIEIFNVCWEMYAAMPAILKDAIETMYIKKGWDVENSIYIGKGIPQYPTFADLLAVLPELLDASEYSVQAKSDYKGALVARVKSLTNGLFGQIFCAGYGIPDATLFDQPTIVDLSRIGSTESKALIMGILVMRLGEYRSTFQSVKKLRHVTILEEAHNLLKRTDAEASRLTSKSVEMISNSIAEMRSKGEGFMIVDQSPTAVDISAIKNTSTKIIMRLPETTDCEVAGNALGLNEYQIKEIPRLPTGVAIIMQNNWVDPVLAKIDKTDRPSNHPPVQQEIDHEALCRIRGCICTALLEQRTTFYETGNLSLADIVAAVDALSDISEEKKQEFTEFVANRLRSATATITGFDRQKWLGRLFLDLLCCRSLFRYHEFPVPSGDRTPPTDKEIAMAEAWQECMVGKLCDYVSDVVDYTNRIQLLFNMTLAIWDEKRSEKTASNFYTYIAYVINNAYERKRAET